MKWLAVLTGLAIAVSALPAGALEVIRTGEIIGDRPSVFAPKQVDKTRWLKKAIEKTALAPRQAASGLSPAKTPGGFRLTKVPSKLRARTQELLTEFGAREENGRILITLPGDVLFDFDKSEVRPDAEPVLDRLIEVLQAFRASPVEVIGHTDSKGADDYNLALSDRRAASVKAYLAAGTIARKRITTSGKGEAEPVAPNARPDGSDDPAGRQRNRRVEFVIGASAD